MRQVQYLDRELSKYRECLESMRPKQNHDSEYSELTPQKEWERKCGMVNVYEEDRIEPSASESEDEPLDLTQSALLSPKQIALPSRENADMVARPTLKFSVQESLSVSRFDNDGNSDVTEIMNKEIHTPNQAMEFDGTLSLDHHMSITIRRLDLNDESNESFQSDCDVRNDGVSEGATIINALFDKKQRVNRILLQKYFMRWMHFTTIEKLTKRNPDQSRLRKMEIFLQNITIERKKTIEKLKAINKGETTRFTQVKPKFTTDSPELLARKFNNK